MYASSLAPVIEGTKSQYPVIIVGAGQAGLAMSWCLKQQNIEHILLEAGESICPNWDKQRWDKFCLVTPNWQCQLPGFPYQGDDPDGFMVKEQIIDYLQAYYESFNPPVLFHCRVSNLSKTEAGFALETSRGNFMCDQVVLACGSYHRPQIPQMAYAMPESIQHVHSCDYKNAASLPPGDVLVVGTGQSGCQIAEDLHLEGRKVHLSVGSAPRVCRRYRGKDVVQWLDDMGYYTTTIKDHPEGDRAHHATNHYVTGRDGGRDLNLRIFAEQGMKLYGKLTGCDNTNLYFDDDLQYNLENADAVAARINQSIEDFIVKNKIEAPADTNVWSDYLPDSPSELDLTTSKISTVIWATGFKMDFKWVKLPVFKDGYPVTERGVTAVPGLYFLGLNWMNTWGSGRFYHVGRDAEYLCGQIRTKANTLKVGHRASCHQAS